MPHSRHQPEHTVLHQVVRKHLDEFLRTRKEETGAVPAFITRAWRSYQDCGLVGAGFARLRCESCLHDHIVWLSCAGRSMFSGDRVGGEDDDAPRLSSERSANKLRAVVDGFNLEATTTVKQRDREALGEDLPLSAAWAAGAGPPED